MQLEPVGTGYSAEDRMRAAGEPALRSVQVIDSAHLVTLPGGGAVMVGAPPEALKVLVLWEYPSPGAVVLPPDPLYADGINQASFEFLLFNHLFRMNGLRDRNPFLVICDPEQEQRVTALARNMLCGPTEREMAAWGVPRAVRRQLALETTVVSGEAAELPIETMVRVLPFRDGRITLPGGVLLENAPDRELRVTAGGESVQVPRRAPSRAPLPLYFADVERPVVGPRFGLQVIGSASGFSGAEWGSCFIVWINGQPLIIDGTPYLDDHLRRLGIEDDDILGYLITHNHEDHANTIGQLVGRRAVTVLTSAPVMAGLVSRLTSILDCPEKEVRQLFRWVPLHPGLEGFGEPLHWFGAEIRTWYSVHTVPTLGVDISMEGRHVRMPGDTLWGRQLAPLVERGVVSPARYDFILHTYDGADVIVADAGGGPIHPDPQEVGELVAHHNGCRLMVTHIPEFARTFLPTAEPGTAVELIPRAERTPEEAMALFGSPLLRDVPERWLLALLHGGEVIAPEEALPAGTPSGGAFFVLAGSISLRDGGKERFALQKGDLFASTLAPQVTEPVLVSTAKWTRLLRIPEALFSAFLGDTQVRHRLERLYRTRSWWEPLIGEPVGLDTLTALAEICRDRTYQPGEEIVRQGDPASHFYVVVEGTVEVVRRNGQERLIGTFGPGYHFGEIALLGRETRTATVRAYDTVRVLQLSTSAFRRHLMRIPLARYRICRAAASRRAAIIPAPSRGESGPPRSEQPDA